MIAAPALSLGSRSAVAHGSPTAIGPMRAPLVDSRGRRMRKLRLSITDRCDLGCVYCQPHGGVRTWETDTLKPAEIEGMVRTLVECGIETVRITGGEPLLRPDFAAVASALESIQVDKAITTNGQHLSNRSRLLASTGFKTVNISIDSLDAERFANITGGGSLQRVLDGLLAVRAEGMEAKINCVVLRGVNDAELAAFHDLSASTGIEVRFLELLAAGPGRDLQPRHFLSFRETLARLEHQVGPLSEIPSPPDSTVRRFLSISGARLGFMASESEPFCGACSRLRISSRGILHPCLFKDEGVDLRHLDADAIEARVRATLEMKPLGREPSSSRSLRSLGG